jgi:hypothetical protein
MPDDLFLAVRCRGFALSTTAFRGRHLWSGQIGNDREANRLGQSSIPGEVGYGASAGIATDGAERPLWVDCGGSGEAR